MRYLLTFTLATIASAAPVYPQSNLLEDVKRNPEEAIDFCENFKELNSRGISATSKKSLQQVSAQKNINNIEAEILSMYIRGLFCPEIF